MTYTLHKIIGLLTLFVLLMGVYISTPNALALSCTQEYNPVCGNDGKTYTNECMMLQREEQADTRTNQIGIAYPGECKDNTNEQTTDIDMTQCASYYDGCNTCSVNEDGTLGACTKRACQTYEDPYCIQPRIPTAEPTMCTREYQPVCAAVQVQCVTEPCSAIQTNFSNNCEWENYKSQYPTSELLYQGECENPGAPVKQEQETPELCTMEYMPVCGIDGNTYGNACGAGDTPIAYEAECETLSTRLKTNLSTRLAEITNNKSPETINTLLQALQNLLQERKDFMTRASFTPQGAQKYERVNHIISFIITELRY